MFVTNLLVLACQLPAQAIQFKHQWDTRQRCNNVWHKGESERKRILETANQKDGEDSCRRYCTYCLSYPDLLLDLFDLSTDCVPSIHIFHLAVILGGALLPRFYGVSIMGTPDCTQCAATCGLSSRKHCQTASITKSHRWRSIAILRWCSGETAAAAVMLPWLLPLRLLVLLSNAWLPNPVPVRDPFRIPRR